MISDITSMVIIYDPQILLTGIDHNTLELTSDDLGLWTAIYLLFLKSSCSDSGDEVRTAAIGLQSGSGGRQEAYLEAHKEIKPIDACMVEEWECEQCRHFTPFGNRIIGPTISVDFLTG